MRIGLQLLCNEEVRLKTEYVIATFCKVLQLETAVLAPDFPVSECDGLVIRYTDLNEDPASANADIVIHKSKRAASFFAGNDPLKSEDIIFAIWGERCVPILFSDDENGRNLQTIDVNSVQANQLIIPFDLFASAFYFLSCWDEEVVDARDEHGRFQYKDSLAAKLAIPENIGDIYLDLFIAALNQASRGLWPAIEIPEWGDGAQFVVCLTHDVDEVKKSYLSRLKFLGTHVTKPVTAHQSTPLPTRFRFALSSLVSQKDPYWTYPDYPPLEKSYGYSASYFFQSELQGNAYYSLTEPKINSFMHALIAEGFEVGLHGTYHAAESKEKFNEEFQLLSETIDMRPTGHRQHFLRMKNSKTFSIYEEAGISYDTTLGYAEQEGYRNQFSYPFQPFNHQENRAYHFLELPTVIMDVTLASYRNLSADKAWRAIEKWLHRTAVRRGCMTILWHNPWEGMHPHYFELYAKILAWIQANNGTGLAGRDVLNAWNKR